MSIWTIGVLLIGCDAEWSKRVADTVANPPQDQDGDGFIAAEDAAEGDVWADCDDLNPAVNPYGTESCNGRDDDCDGLIDDADNDVVLLVWARDADGDGYGDPALLSEACEQPIGSAPRDAGEDCDDTDPSINPGMRELCDAVGGPPLDEDCDDRIDEDDPNLDPGTRLTWLLDADADGYGDPADVVLACAGPDGYLLESDPTDCDDDDPDSGPCLDPGRLGLSLTGLGQGTAAGTAVDAAGDMDGDGALDLIVGAPGEAGGVWLVLGPATGGRLSALGIPLTGDGEQAGAAVAGVGDLDGDGLDEAVVGAWRAGEDAGALTVLRWPLEASLLAEAPDRREGALAGGFLGASVDGAGDVDGDGLDDVIVGAPGADEAWLLYGPIVGVSAPEGARLSGARWLGAAVAGVGDLDGDGLDDVAVGAAGEAAVFLGPVGDADWADAAAIWVGEDDAGRALSSADLDGDGRRDLLIAQGETASGYPGRIHVLADGLVGGALDAVDVIEGTDRDEAWRVHSAGDLDGDGDDELIVGAPGRAGGGAAQLVYGPVSGVVSLGGLWPVFSGAGDRDRLGEAVVGGVDADGDGLPDLLLGAPGVSEGGEGSGVIYLIPGSTLTALPTP